MESPIIEKKIIILKRNISPKNDVSQPNLITSTISSGTDDTFVKPPNPTQASKPEDSTETLKKPSSNSEQQNSTHQPNQLTNHTAFASQKDKKEKKDKKGKKDKKAVDKQIPAQHTNKVTSSALSANTTQNNSGKSQLVERKKDISDRICDFIYSGKFISPKEFLKLQLEREEICDKLEQLDISHKKQDIVSNSTASNNTTNAKPNENNKSKSESKDLNTAKTKNTPPSTSSIQNEGPDPEYTWSEEVKETLQKVFGMCRFKHNQLKAINATLRGDDVFVLMPTGGGKSLCYQLPALINSGKTKGITIVISPLLALVQDQAESLKSLGIQSFALNSDSTAEEKVNFFNDLKSQDPQIKIAYITPEMLNKSTGVQDLLKDLYERQRLSRFVIDEAHCVSQWGHEFRPDYKHIGFVKTLYPDIPLIALTATANDRVKADIKKRLNIQNCLTLTQSFNRKNLYYEIRKKTDKTVVSDIYSYITNNHPESCGIIYCHSRKSCEELADELSSKYNLDTVHYHAGLSKEDRQRIQKDWQNGEFKVIVATVAFGMGIDKPDVRFVIHHSLPYSLEAYYQETGRAGRDGIESECILFYNYSDKQKIERFIEDGKGHFDSKEHSRNNLNRVVQFCENLIDCKREQILAYFGEKFDRAFCYKSCDNCVTALKYRYIQKDVTTIAKNIVKIVKITQSQNVSMRVLLLLFKGSASKESKSYNLDPPLLGCGKELPVDDSKRLIHDLILKKILIETSVYNRIGYASTCLFTGPSAKTLLNGKTTINMPFKEPLIKPE